MTADHDHDVHDDAAAHVHSHSLTNISLGRWASRVVVGLLAVIGILVVAGVILLWPSQIRVSVPSGPQTPTLAKGEVSEQLVGDCNFSPSGNGQLSDTEPHPVLNPDGGCLNSSVRITSGPDAGKWTVFSIGTQRMNVSAVPGKTSPDAAPSGIDLSRPATPGTGQPDLAPGTKIMMSWNGGGVAGSPSNYAFYDYARGVSLWVWGLVFAAVVIAVAQWRGLRALLGLALSGVVIVFFALPSILDGHSAVWVALVASAVILYLVLYLAHGVSLRTSAALLGTLCSLAVCGVLAWLATATTQVTGLSSEDTTNLQAYAATVSTSGVLLAGFVIGALGVLNDVTITQSSATFELAKLSPKSSRRRTFLSAMRVGRDHIASTVYTLVFAYVGTALPLLLLFSIAGRPLGQVLTSDSVAIELVRAFVGGIGLALSVPLTTAIATLLAKPKRVAVSAEAAKRYTQSHPDADPSEIRVRERRAAAARAAATTAARADEQLRLDEQVRADERVEQERPAPVPPPTGQLPVAPPTGQFPVASRPATPHPEGHTGPHAATPRPERAAAARRPETPRPAPSQQVTPTPEPRPGRRRLPDEPIPAPPRPQPRPPVLPGPPAQDPPLRRGRHSAD
ncbi:YibE/F family protein [Tsukamurella ocularis]|uniref:YibE/F family protein n=1 Tax=Tsukamurella ocularis TaxID=1970234 RepID=UPI00216A33D8|nr:YibE/F family protein [Tsukamurella ocularis]MCS3781386.1 putative membrane protein [Tsukamurella ocularis]